MQILAATADEEETHGDSKNNETDKEIVDGAEHAERAVLRWAESCVVERGRRA